MVKGWELFLNLKGWDGRNGYEMYFPNDYALKVEMLKEAYKSKFAKHLESTKRLEEILLVARYKKING